jgi:hypothetical protein
MTEKKEAADNEYVVPRAEEIREAIIKMNFPRTTFRESIGKLTEGWNDFALKGGILI